MGADLILEWLQIDKKKKPDFKAGENYIDSLADKPLEEWPSDYVDRWIGEIDEETDKEEHVANLKSSLKIVGEAWDRSYRDTSVVEICHKRILITGGMSWGDSPTDTFDDMDKILSSGVAKACGFDA